MKSLLLIALTVSVIAATQSRAADEPPVKAILEAQAKSWNDGDIDKFMEHYWKSDELTFSSGGKTTRGWAATLAGYKKRYPNRAAMGTLTFDNLEITPLGAEAALVLGHWHLKRDRDKLDGCFSLIFRKIDGRWLIVHDHTSRLEEK